MSKHKQTADPIELSAIPYDQLKRLYTEYKARARDCQSIADQIKRELKTRKGKVNG